MATSAENSGYRRQHWLHWCLTFATVFVIGSLVLPLVRSQPKSVHEFADELPDWLRIPFVFLLCVVFTLSMFKLFSPRLKQLQHFWTHPPTWFAAVLGVIVVAAVDVLVRLSPKIYTASVWEWLEYGGGAMAIVALYKWLTTPVKAPQQPSSGGQTAGDAAAPADWQSLEAWLQSDAPAKCDFLGSRVVARRLRDMLLGGARSVGIIGPFGAGKTSIVGWIVELLEANLPQGKPTLLISKHSCWGFENSSSAIQSMLKGGLGKVTEGIDTFRVSSLPDTYRQMFSLAGEWFDKVSKVLVGQRDPIEQFLALSALLGDMNARLVFIVEDLDRNNSRSFDIQEVLAFLQQLKDFDNLSFVLTAGINAPAQIDFAKLCDHIEYMKTISTEVSGSVVQLLREQCLDTSAFPHQILTPSDDNEWNPSRWILLSDRDEVRPPAAVASLLNTPRSLRHALGRTYRAWQVLCGEVDWDHLFAVNVLRFAAPEAFTFAVRNWRFLRDRQSNSFDDGKQARTIRERLRREWIECTKGVEWDARSARALLDLILPATAHWLNDGLYIGGTARIQGVQEDRYWRRAINEVIDQSEVPDQVVVRDLRSWIQNPVGDSELVRGLCRSESYSGVWEHFAFRSLDRDTGQILLLCGQVLAHIRDEHGADASSESQGFVAVWRYADRHVERGDQSREWLKAQITDAAAVSLELVNNLWYYWCSGKFTILRPEDCVDVRGHLLQVLNARITNGESLAQIVHTKHRYVLYQLVFDPGNRGNGSHVGPAAWSWLAPSVLQALRHGNVTVAISTCGLITARDSQGRSDPTAVDPTILVEFFGDHARDAVDAIAALAGRVDAADRQFIDDIVRTARDALKNRETPPSGE